MRVIIAGSRGFTDYELLNQKCLELIPKLKEEQSKTTTIVQSIIIVSGHAQGADLLGERFAKENRLCFNTFIPTWQKNGKINKAAGYERNMRMAKFAKEDNESILIAFWDGKSKGTKHMIDIAKKLGIDKIEVILYNQLKDKDNG